MWPECLAFIVQVIHSLFGYSEPVPSNKHAPCFQSRSTLQQHLNRCAQEDSATELAVGTDQSVPADAARMSEAHAYGLSRCIISFTYGYYIYLLFCLGYLWDFERVVYISFTLYH